MIRTDNTIAELLQQVSLNRPEYGYEIMSVDGHVIHVIGTKEQLVPIPKQTEG